MNKRTNSHSLILNHCNTSKRKQAAQHAANVSNSSKTLEELAELRSKVAQSQPILESIYDKVKRKEQAYQ